MDQWANTLSSCHSWLNRSLYEYAWSLTSQGPDWLSVNGRLGRITCCAMSEGPMMRMIMSFVWLDWKSCLASGKVRIQPSIRHGLLQTQLTTVGLFGKPTSNYWKWLSPIMYLTVPIAYFQWTAEKLSWFFLSGRCSWYAIQIELGVITPSFLLLH